jgi:hypothetical protein
MCVCVCVCVCVWWGGASCKCTSVNKKAITIAFRIRVTKPLVTRVIRSS